MLVGVLVLAFLAGEQAAFIEPTGDGYPALVHAYYQTRMPHPDETVFHGIRAVGERSVRGRSTTMVCVSYTMRLRFGGRTTQTEALYFEAERVVKREGGNEASNACVAIMFAPQ